MHQIAFDLKRGHLKTLAYGEQVLRSVPGMTGARFDLLCLVREKFLSVSGIRYEPLTRWISQRELVQRLDVDKSTISKMLRRLEEMGWIRRERARPRYEGGPRDWRRKIVFLTPLGLQRIAKAMRIMFRQRVLLKYFERIYKTTWPYRKKHVVKMLAHVRGHIELIANAFGDRSIVHYDHGPRLQVGPLDYADLGHRRDFHPLYVPPPPPKQPPRPLTGDERQPCRPMGYTAYEVALRKFIWNEEKPRRRRRRATATATEAATATATATAAATTTAHT